LDDEEGEPEPEVGSGALRFLVEMDVNMGERGFGVSPCGGGREAMGEGREVGEATRNEGEILRTIYKYNGE
jgi:hypothetical protein